MDRKFIPLLATAGVLIALFGVAASLLYELDLPVCGWSPISFRDNAVLGVTAVGMTFVILSGGIDLSVGSIAAFTTILMASLVGKCGLHPVPSAGLALLLGGLFGWVQGGLIQRYELPAFLVTLGGMFFARGMSFVVNMQSVGISHHFYSAVQDLSIPLSGKASLSAVGMILLAMFILAFFVAHYTAFGRNIYALGGNAESSRLMGLPVSRTRPAVYAVSGFCAALAGVVATIYTGSGNPAMGVGLELDAIAAVVIGGTLLSGGVGFVAGTLLGVMIFGTIQSALIFDGRLNSWWLRIAVGTLLLVFILLQRFLTGGSGRRATH